MNKLFFILTLSFILASCKQEFELEKYDKNGNPIVYNQDVYTKMWTKNKKLKVTIIDTFCINQVKKAKKDIKKGKLIYFRPNYLEFNKLSVLLLKYGIETKDFNFSCIRIGGFQPYCYQEEMHKEIQRKFGKKFIDSLTEIAKKEYIIENPNVEYIENGVDLRKKFLEEKNSH